MTVPIETRRTGTMHVGGVTTVTSNASEMQPETAKIAGLWERFAIERWADRLGDAGAHGPIIAVYSEYASGVNGTYRLLIGRELGRDAMLPDEAVRVEIRSGRYLVFSFPGPLPDVVIQGWQHIWRFFGRSETQRAYTADLEIYPATGTGVDIWIAVK